MKLIEAMARTFGVPPGFFFADYDTSQAGLPQEEMELLALVRSASISPAQLRPIFGFSPAARQAIIDRHRCRDRRTIRAVRTPCRPGYFPKGHVRRFTPIQSGTLRDWSRKMRLPKFLQPVVKEEQCPTQNPSSPTSRRRALTAGGIRQSIPQCSGVSGSAVKRGRVLVAGQDPWLREWASADELIMSLIDRFLDSHAGCGVCLCGDQWSVRPRGPRLKPAGGILRQLRCWTRPVWVSN